MVDCFPLDLFNLMLDTTSQEEFGSDEYAFNQAVGWQKLRISSSSVAAPFVGCAAYTEGRRVKFRLERIFGLDGVRSVYHSREHGATCFLFHAHSKEAGQLLEEDDAAGGSVRLQHLAAFPSNLKVVIYQWASYSYRVTVPLRHALQ